MRLSLILSAVFAPIPSTRSSPPPATNFFSSAREETLNFWWSRAAVFGPMPGISNRSSALLRAFLQPISPRRRRCPVRLDRRSSPRWLCPLPESSAALSNHPAGRSLPRVWARFRALRQRCDKSANGKDRRPESPSARRDGKTALRLTRCPFGRILLRLQARCQPKDVAQNEFTQRLLVDTAPANAARITQKDNESIARRVYRLAALMDIRGDDPFRLRSYRNAAEAIETWPTPLERSTRTKALLV